MTALEPIGAAILDVVLPVIEALGKALTDNQDTIRALVKEFIGLIDAIRPLGDLLRELGFGDVSFKSILNDAIRLVATLRDITEITVAAIETSVRAVIATLADEFRGLLSRLGISVDDFVTRNFKRIAELAPRLEQGFANLNRVNAEIAKREQAVTTPTTPGTSAPPIVGRPRTATTLTDEALQKAKQFRDAQLSLERERIEQMNRILKAEGDARLQEFERQYEDGLVTFRQLSDAKIAIQHVS